MARIGDGCVWCLLLKHEITKDYKEQLPTVFRAKYQTPNVWRS